MAKTFMIQPYELVVNKVLPAVRARLAQILTEESGMKQVEVARRLGVTQAAVSHYNSGSRGADTDILALFPEVEEFCQDLARRIAGGLQKPEEVAILNEFSRRLIMTERFCNYHRRLADLGDCNVCHEFPP